MVAPIVISIAATAAIEGLLAAIEYFNKAKVQDRSESEDFNKANEMLKYTEVLLKDPQALQLLEKAYGIKPSVVTHMHDSIASSNIKMVDLEDRKWRLTDQRDRALAHVNQQSVGHQRRKMKDEVRRLDAAVKKTGDDIAAENKSILANTATYNKLVDTGRINDSDLASSNNLTKVGEIK